MENFYYSVKQDNKSWRECDQFVIEAENWMQFIQMVHGIAKHLKKEVRACTSKGYDNQGTYLAP